MSTQRPPVDGPRFLELVVLSGLLSIEQVQEFTARYPADQRQRIFSKVKLLADEFVEQELLTSWQAILLLDGKYKGFLLGKYKLLKLLGSGGMSSVYLAEHSILGRRVAVKVLPHSKTSDPVALAHFMNSARNAALLLKNDHFFHPRDIDSVGVTHYIVMDYEPGISLKALVQQQGPLSYLAAANYIAQAADGLDALHTAQMLHLHLDPEHLYLTESRVIKLLGMGINWGTEAERQHFGPFIREKILTQTAVDYHSPEFRIATDHVGPRSDIYSLGCTFYFLLTGQPTYPLGTSPERIQQHSWEVIPVVRDTQPEAPLRLIQILQRMLAKNPSDRYASAGHLYRDLDAFLRDEGGAGQLALVP